MCPMMGVKMTGESRPKKNGAQIKISSSRSVSSPPCFSFGGKLSPPFPWYCWYPKKQRGLCRMPLDPSIDFVLRVLWPLKLQDISRLKSFWRKSCESSGSHERNQSFESPFRRLDGPDFVSDNVDLTKYDVLVEDPLFSGRSVSRLWTPSSWSGLKLNFLDQNLTIFRGFSTVTETMYSRVYHKNTFFKNQISPTP